MSYGFTSMIHKAKDLSPNQKTAIESLLGRHVMEEETISVRAFEPPAISDERRQEITEQLKRYFAEVDANRKAVSDEEADTIITEALRSSRPSYRPHQ
jgi:L-lactate utilization protein LutC